MRGSVSEKVTVLVQQLAVACSDGRCCFCSGAVMVCVLQLPTFGGLMPMSSYSSGCVSGSSTASLISCTWLSRPPTSA